MHRGIAASIPARQQGATLVIALLILVLIMMIGITAVSTSNTQFKLAGNLQFEDSALNNAEAAVTAAEVWLAAGTNHKNAGFTAYNRAVNPQLYPMGRLAGLANPDNSPLTMTWRDSIDSVNTANSVSINDPISGARNTSQR